MTLLDPPAVELDLDPWALLAEMTATAERERTRADNLALALESNRTIGAAIGVVMAEYRLAEPAAFAILVRLSQDSNRKLRLVALDLLACYANQQPAGAARPRAATSTPTPTPTPTPVSVAS